MSKTINIIVDRTTQQATGDKIRTTLMEGGSQDWVPQEEYSSLIDKENVTIDENGTYLPSDYSCDAIGTVIVKFGDGEGENGLNKYKGPGTINGINPATGEPTSVSTDEDGNIVLSEIPKKIRIITEPNDISYEGGETIDYTGIVVCAYKADDSAFPIDGGEGIFGNQIPFSELTFPTTIMPEREGVTTEITVPVEWYSKYSELPYEAELTLYYGEVPGTGLQTGTYPLPTSFSYGQMVNFAVAHGITNIPGEDGYHDTTYQAWIVTNMWYGHEGELSLTACGWTSADSTITISKERYGYGLGYNYHCNNGNATTVHFNSGSVMFTNGMDLLVTPPEGIEPIFYTTFGAEIRE